MVLFLIYAQMPSIFHFSFWFLFFLESQEEAH
jgi:hypothetical protein